MDTARAGYFMDDSANESGCVQLYLQWTSGVTGAVTTINRQSGFGLVSPATASVVRTGVGLFTVQFSQAWALKYLSVSPLIQQTTYSAAGACEVQILTDSLVATTGVMTIEITNAAGAAVDPTTGDVITLAFTMQTHTAGY